MWKRRSVGEISHTQRSSWESERSAETELQSKSKLYIVFKLPRDQHGHALSPCNVCFSLTMVYTNSILLLHWSPRHFYASGIMFTHFCFPVVTLLILSTTGCICQLHPPDSSPVNAICYNMNLTIFPQLFTNSKDDLVLYL